jgi:hypothetical protein
MRDGSFCAPSPSHSTRRDPVRGLRDRGHRHARVARVSFSLQLRAGGADPRLRRARWSPASAPAPPNISAHARRSYRAAHGAGPEPATVCIASLPLTVPAQQVSPVSRMIRSPVSRAPPGRATVQMATTLVRLTPSSASVAVGGTAEAKRPAHDGGRQTGPCRDLLG